MAYNPNDLSVLAYANNFTLWHYITKDDSVTSSGYFDNASDMLRVNDLIIACTESNGSPDTTFYVVTAKDGTNVTIAVYS